MANDVNVANQVPAPTKPIPDWTAAAADLKLSNKIFYIKKIIPGSDACGTNPNRIEKIETTVVIVPSRHKS